MADPTSSHPRDHVHALAGGGWTRVSDRILHGLNHDLNGRVSALMGLSYLLDSAGGEEATRVAPFLDEELAQLEEAVRLLQLLPDDSREAELLAPAELLPLLTKLVVVQRGLEGVAMEFRAHPGAGAVRVDRTFFIRAMILLLTGAGEAALAGGGRRVEVVQEATEAGAVLFRILPGGEARPAEGRSGGPAWVLPEAMERVVGAGLEVEGGSLRKTESSYEVRLPAP